MNYTSRATLWEKIVFVAEVTFKTLQNIYDGVFCENSLRLKAANYFRNKTPS